MHHILRNYDDKLSNSNCLGQRKGCKSKILQSSHLNNKASVQEMTRRRPVAGHSFSREMNVQKKPAR